ncbi:tetratricopeptide repeat protein [Shewanella maritima]|uniref:tetratricopeptide repeat protein n=1 Tax=Shewanella maritima TaxID=2520507 RepID=UPI0037351411
MKYVILATLLASPFISFSSHSSIQTQEKSLIEECHTQECNSYFVRFKTFSKSGYVDAMYMLGELYYQGYGTKKNEERALKWFRKASKFDLPHAQFKAGVIYIRPGENQDIERGIKYLKKAHKNNFNPATHLLGLLYLEGEYVSKDMDVATQYFKQTYANNYPDSVKFIALNKMTDGFETIYQSAPKAVESVVKPTGEMETISVTAPQLTEVFDLQLSLFQTSFPDGAAGTGTRISGRGCDEMISCGFEQDKERMREFFMVGWR